jgi:hypothetical protein
MSEHCQDCASWTFRGIIEHTPEGFCTYHEEITNAMSTCVMFVDKTVNTPGSINQHKQKK